MKLLKDKTEIEVLDYTSNYIETITKAARTCYKSIDKSEPESDELLLRRLIERGHEAMLEFAGLTVRFKNISRGMTHEMVRHRLCSFAQESTRYVDYDEISFIVPPNKHEDMLLRRNELDGMRCEVSAREMMEDAELHYKTLRYEDWAPQDARQVLPIATKTELVVRANMREWRKIFLLRTAHDAHWEIRSAIMQVLRWTKENMPILVEDFFIKDTEAFQFKELRAIAKEVRKTAEAKQKSKREIIMELGHMFSVWDDEWK